MLLSEGKVSPDYFAAVVSATSEKSFRAEMVALAQYLLSEELPSSEDAFRRHAKYVLEKHLPRSQIIRPSHDPVGFFKGQPVYARTSVATVHSKTRWKFKGRSVKEGAVAHPVRQLEPRREGDKPVPLYGEWQTEPLVALEMQGDQVPKNEYGNIEIFCPEMCPNGAVHLDTPLAEKAARQLGLPFTRYVWDSELLVVTIYCDVNDCHLEFWLALKASIQSSVVSRCLPSTLLQLLQLKINF